MKYFLDTEFIEDGKTIDLISIAIVRDDGMQMYMVSSEYDESKASKWVVENVLKHVSGEIGHSREEIKNEMLGLTDGDMGIEFWGYYCDYDWVVFCWLFGTMMDLPKHFPMYCNDLKQLCVSLGNPQLPKDPENEHNSLADARWNKKIYDYLKNGGYKKS